MLEEDGVFCAWQNDYRPASRLCDFYITLFSEQEDGTYLREDARDRERMYTLRSIRRMLHDTGFEVISVTDGYTNGVITDQTERYTIVARAKK